MASRDRGSGGIIAASGSGRNGLVTGYHDYSYRGERTMEAELPYACAGPGCGRRMDSDRWPLCAVCRGTWEERCPDCRFTWHSKSHQRLCGGQR